MSVIPRNLDHAPISHKMAQFKQSILWLLNLLGQFRDNPRNGIILLLQTKPEQLGSLGGESRGAKKEKGTEKPVRLFKFLLIKRE